MKEENEKEKKNNKNIMSFKEVLYNTDNKNENILDSETSSNKLLQIKERMEVPYFLLNQAKKSCWNYICCCCCKDNKYELINSIDSNELEIYYDLKDLLTKKFINNLYEHESSLKFLFLISLKCDLTEDLNSENWKKIGFSNSNPRIDLIDFEGGYFIILFLSYFIKQYDDIYNEIYNNNFCLVKICILCISFFKLSFDFFKNKNEGFKQREYHQIKLVDIKQFIGFVNCPFKDINYVYDILFIIIICIFKKFQNIVFENVEEKNKFIEKETKNIFQEIFYTELKKEFSSVSFDSSSNETE